VNVHPSSAVKGFDLESLNRELTGTIFKDKVQYFPETASTNTLAMGGASRGAPEGTVFLADQQTQGRGRGGHSWHTEPHSSLLFSFIVRPKILAADALWLSLMAGVAVSDAVRDATQLRPDLRWPNDLLLNRKKFCGILTELSTDGAAVRHAVIGIGVNVNQSSFPEGLSSLATSLRIESGTHWSRTELLAALLKSLNTEYNSLIADLARIASPDRLLVRLKSSSSYVEGKHVHVSEAEGYEGITAGLDDRGFLLVRTTDGVRKVISGGVRELD
jgi:BirA family transcriptional regulator, biotin operon repressor / biotin---[acetyl-CoA-carboxylase] ligase